ncbi:MAG: hypothetical protein HY000_03170 [Planctomycetes bacterium]|nr:hypothetical protein [Planctomycetota bacterium]
MAANVSEDSRIVSLDQFRGYTVLGMFFVNFVGHFQAIPAIFKHHNTYCSYADTIMPQFFFAVGFAYRITLVRRLQTAGLAATYFRVLKRSLGLILLGAVIYHLDGGVKAWSELRELGLRGFFVQAFQRNLFQTLVHIGVTSLWVMPVIASGPAVRIGFLCGSGVLHLLLSHWFYYDWVMRRPGIDGGPLGFLTWTVPLLVGSLAQDAMAAHKDRPPVARLFVAGAILMAIGYALACVNLVTPPAKLPIGPQAATPGTSGPLAWLVEPPFVPPTQPINLWTMSQRAGSISYLTFGAGFSLAVYTLFVLACDVGRLSVGILRTFGTNALAGYVIHDLVNDAIKPYAPKDSPLWFGLAAFVLFLGICYVFVRYLEKNRIFLRL